MGPAFEAVFWGFVSGGALVLGAAVGFFVNVPSRVVAGIMATLACEDWAQAAGLVPPSVGP